mgnify:CR=1 FL=1
MTKQDLVAKIAGINSLSKKQAEEMIDSVGAVVTDALLAGDEVTLPGIGKLSAVQRAARIGRNPQTGEEVKIAAKRAPKFSAAKALKDALNVKAAKGKKK